MITKEGFRITFEQCLSQQDTAYARSITEIFLQSHADDPEAPLFAGQALLALHRFEQAYAVLKEAKRLDPNDISISLTLSSAMERLAKTSEAISLLEKICLQHPHLFEAWHKLGCLYVKTQQNNQALNAFAKAVSLDPAHIDVHCNLGLLFFKTQQFPEATTEFNNVLALSPNHPLAHLHLAHIAWLLNDLSTAIAHYQTVHHHHPEHIDSQINLGACYMKQREFQSAIEAFQKALHIDGEHRVARENLAAALLEAGYYRQAMVQYEMLLKEKPDHPEFLSHLGTAHMTQGHLNEALRIFNHLATHAPSHAVYGNLGACHLKLNDREKAKACFKKALQLKPQDPVYTYHLTVLHPDTSLPSKAPDEYVKHLFDNYAGYFDTHAETGLGYQVPNILAQRLHQFLPSPPYRILDLGCGTGLLGAALYKPDVQIIGVDLSYKMLQKAKTKHCYTELIEGEIGEILRHRHETFEAITAADVLVYSGELSELIRLISEHLTPQGLFAFTVENTPIFPYQLQETGRFAHHETYLFESFTQHQLICLNQEVITLRFQHQVSLKGTLYILQKKHA